MLEVCTCVRYKSREREREEGEGVRGEGMRVEIASQATQQCTCLLNSKELQGELTGPSSTQHSLQGTSQQISLPGLPMGTQETRAGRQRGNGTGKKTGKLLFFTLDTHWLPPPSGHYSLWGEEGARLATGRLSLPPLLSLYHTLQL